MPSSIRMRAAFAHALIALAWAKPSEAAAPARMAVISFAVGDDRAVPKETDILHTAREAALHRPSVLAPSADDVLSPDRAELTRRASRCAADIRCIARVLAAYDADLGLVVVLDAQTGPVLVSTWLVECASGRILSERFFETGRRPTSVQKRLLAGFESLLDQTGHRRIGRLTLDVRPASARVRIDGQVLSDSRSEPVRTLELAPGNHTLTLDADGFEQSQRDVMIQAGAESSLSVELRAQGSIWSSPWLWVGLGVAAAGAAAATTALLSDNSRCICVQTRDGPMCQICQ